MPTKKKAGSDAAAAASPIKKAKSDGSANGSAAATAVDAKHDPVLKLLEFTPSAESIDYVQTKQQFQLHTLLTEQRHEKTWNLSQTLDADVKSGLDQLFSVDEDITSMIHTLCGDADRLAAINRAAAAVEKAIAGGHQIYVYGCGATGRLAKQMESTFWRPFWAKISRAHPTLYSKVNSKWAHISDRVIGEMTGADRALISSLEGFEDLPVIGRLQLQERGIKKGDVVICVTEGGETSSVIGTILAALEQWKTPAASTAAAGDVKASYSAAETREYLYFIYNNPNDKLLPFTRSATVINEPGITKINLSTGPQSITGSTRLQATTSETFVVAHILQSALSRAIRTILSPSECSTLGFGAADAFDLKHKLSEFGSIQRAVAKCSSALAPFTTREAAVYASNHRTTYYAEDALITVFIDSTERSPTFRLFPLDTVKEPERKCWFQVWTSAPNAAAAWKEFLGRSFKGLQSSFYQSTFDAEITDAYLKRAADNSLKNAGDEQQLLYDFSFADFNIKHRTPKAGDLGVAVLVSSEQDTKLNDSKSDVRRFLALCDQHKTQPVIVSASDSAAFDFKSDASVAPIVVHASVSAVNDPFQVAQQIALKMILNAHSTAVMAKLGKVIGNTMTNVSPSNLKLIGRATFLIQSHVNAILSDKRFKPAAAAGVGRIESVSYPAVNAVLFDAINFLKDSSQASTIPGQTAEVAMCIIRLLEAVRTGTAITCRNALDIVHQTGLKHFLLNLVK